MITNKDFLLELDTDDLARALLFFPCNEICKCGCDPRDLECAQRCASGECEEEVADWLEQEYKEGNIIW